jgi:hypothetical protein
LRLRGSTQTNAGKHQAGGKRRGKARLLFFDPLKIIDDFFHFISCTRNAGGLILISDLRAAG